MIDGIKKGAKYVRDKIGSYEESSEVIEYREELKPEEEELTRDDQQALIPNDD